MDFILANKAMEKGKRVRRRCWNEGVYLKVNDMGTILQYGPESGRGAPVKAILVTEATDRKSVV